MRKHWDHYFMDIALKAAERSTCDRLHVGSVIVKDLHIVSTGYNGSIHGDAHCDDVGHLLNDEGRCVRTIHSEMNAILHANPDKLKGATIYCTHEPCENCMKHINQAGIRRVVYLHEYNNKWNRYFSKGMEVVHYVEETHMQVEKET